MSKSKPKVLIYNTEPTIGGGQRMLVDLLAHLNHSKADYTLSFENNRPGKSFPFDKIPKNIEVIFLVPRLLTILYLFLSQTRFGLLNPLYKVVNSTHKFLAYIFLLARISRNKPDLIINYSTFSLFWVSLLSIRKIAWVHGNVMHLYGFMPGLRIKLLRFTLLRYEKVIVTCEALKNQVIELFPELSGRVEVVYNSMDLSRVREDSLKPVPPSEKHLLENEYLISVCRLDGPKDIETIIHSFASLFPLRRSLYLYIVGGGPQLPGLRDLAIQLGVSERVVFFGARINPMPFLKRAKMFIMSSKHEGFALTIVEAMALGVPVISTDCEFGPAEILNGGQIGKLVPVGDTSAMAKSIQEILDTNNQDSVNAGIERVESFSIKTMGRALSALVDKMVTLQSKHDISNAGKVLTSPNVDIKANSKISTNAVYRIMLSVFRMLAPVVILPIIYRRVGPNNMGQVNHVEAFVNYFAVFMLLGLQNLGIREIGANRHDRNLVVDFVSKVFTLRLVLLVFALPIYFCFFSSGLINVDKSLMFLGLIKIFACIFYFEWANEAIEDYRFITIKTVVVRSIFLFLMVWCVQSPAEFILYYLLMVCYDFVNNFSSFSKLVFQFRVKLINLKISGFFPQVFWGALVAYSGLLFFQVDVLTIGKYGSSSDVAYYGLAHRLVFILLAIATVLTQVISPRLAFYIDKDNEKYKELLGLSGKAVFLFSIPAAMGLWLNADAIIRVFAGSRYLEGIPTLKLFAFYIPIDCFIFITINQCLYLRKKEIQIVLMNLAYGIMNVGLSYLSYALESPAYLSGVLASTLFAKCLLLTNSLVILEKNYRSVVLRDIFPALCFYSFASCVFFPINYFIKFMSLSSIFELSLNVLLCCLVYCLILYLRKDQLLEFAVLKFKKRVA